MIVSTRGRYALRVMIDLAQNIEQDRIPLKEIAERQNISKKYIEAIMTLLSKNHNVSFSQRHTRKVFKPNVSKRTLVINGQKIRCNISTSALRTLKKKGLVESPKARAEKKSSK